MGKVLASQREGPEVRFPELTGSVIQYGRAEPQETAQKLTVNKDSDEFRTWSPANFPQYRGKGKSEMQTLAPPDLMVARS